MKRKKAEIRKLTYHYTHIINILYSYGMLYKGIIFKDDLRTRRFNKSPMIESVQKHFIHLPHI